MNVGYSIKGTQLTRSSSASAVMASGQIVATRKRMSKNLETAKKIIRAYWREVMSDAEYRRSGMSYNDIVATLVYLDDDMEQHIKAVANIMNKALKELQKEKNDSSNKKGQDQTNTNRQTDERADECVGGGDS